MRGGHANDDTLSFSIFDPPLYHKVSHFNISLPLDTCHNILHKNLLIVQKQHTML